MTWHVATAAALAATLWLLKLILTNEYASWGPKAARSAVRLAAALQPNIWREVRREEWLAEIEYIATQPGAQTGLAFAGWIAVRETLRTALAMTWHPVLYVAIALSLMVEWRLPGQSYVSLWLYYSASITVLGVPFALVSRSLRKWSAPDAHILKRLAWWIFTPDLDGQGIRSLGCLLIAMVLAIQGLLQGEVLPVGVLLSYFLMVTTMVHGSRLGMWLHGLGQLQVDLWFRLAGDPPLKFPSRSPV